jgi:drug/metabolite transporter (DMT)-like permease
VPPAPSDLVRFAATGVLGTSGHLFLANAFARSEATRLAPFEYTSLIFAAGLGFVIFGEVPGLLTLAGAGFIIVSALIANRG